MNNIQEYFSPVGSGNSLYFIPNQIDTNEALGCDTFYIVGLVEPVINQYGLFGKTKKKNKRALRARCSLRYAFVTVLAIVIL